MDGVGNGIDQLATIGRYSQRRIAVHVADFATRADWLGQILWCQSLQILAYLPRESQGKGRLGLDARISFASIVVYFIAVQSSEQTGEVIEAMAVVAADGPVEGKWNALDIAIEVYSPQQIIALSENLDRRSQDPLPILCVSTGRLRNRERDGQPALRIGVQLRNRFADGHRFQLSLGVNGHRWDFLELLRPHWLVFAACRRQAVHVRRQEKPAYQGDLLAAEDQDSKAAHKNGHSQGEEKPAIVLHHNSQFR